MKLKGKNMSIPSSLEGKFEIPLIAAPMFLVSGTKLVIEACKNGVIGTFPALNARTTEQFDSWCQEIKNELKQWEQKNNKKAAAFGVNLIVHRSNPRLQADLEVCVKHKIPLIITSLGAVSDIVKTVQDYGGVNFHDVTIKKHALKAAQAGVDGIIAVCAGAGGHAGTLSPFALMHEIRSFFDKTVILAGGISHGKHIRAAEILGADFAYMGTRFIATEESNAQPEYKQMIVDAVATDIVHTPAVSGVPANFMRQSLEANGFDLKKAGEVNFGEKLTLDDEAKAWKDVWSAGHGVSCINDIPKTKELIERIKLEYSQ